jgi:hypothetical protein
MRKYKYSSQNHNWDLTLLSASTLFRAGSHAKNDARLSFSFFTGSMILSVAALESFLNSLASLIPDKEFHGDDFEKQSIEDKLKRFCVKYSVNMDQGKRPFQTVGLAVTWRNRLVHSKPDFIEEVEIQSTGDAKKLSPKKSYEFSVKEEYAKRFYVDILDVIQQIIKVSKIHPRAQCTYSPIS